MGRILEGVRDKDTGNEPAPPSIYHRVNIVRRIDQNNDELLWLAKGMVSEKEKIKRFSTGEYLELLKYTVEHNV